MSTPNGSGLSFAIVDISDAGDNVVVPASEAGFFVRRIVLALGTQTTVQFKAGSRLLSGPIPMTAFGMGFSEQNYYACDPGEDFIITLGDAVGVGGTVWFQRGPV